MSDVTMDLWTGHVGNRGGLTSDSTLDLWTSKKGLMSDVNVDLKTTETD